MIVWILSKGEDFEGGDVLGVYADKHHALGDFADEAKHIDSVFTIDAAERFEDDSVYMHGGCDWLQLVPHDVIGNPQLEK